LLFDRFEEDRRRAEIAVFELPGESSLSSWVTVERIF